RLSELDQRRYIGVGRSPDIHNKVGVLGRDHSVADEMVLEINRLDEGAGRDALAGHHLERDAAGRLDTRGSRILKHTASTLGPEGLFLFFLLQDISHALLASSRIVRGELIDRMGDDPGWMG